MLEYFITFFGIATALIFWVAYRRTRYYAHLRHHCDTLATSTSLPHYTPRPAVAPPDTFATGLNRLEAPLDAHQFQRLTQEITTLSETERSYIPTHKKGGTIAYETLCAKAPGIVAFYQSPELAALISRIVGTRVVPTPLHDQSSCSILCYEKPGDHIGWHYDHNFYDGRHFTALIPLVNQGDQPDKLSSANLMAKLQGCETTIPTHPNSLIVFEGARVLHKVTPLGPGERRVILSMTFTENPRNNWIQDMARRIKDMAFFGIRALWT